MRVQLDIDGGIAYFPGLSKPIVVDSNDLPQHQADTLQQLIAEARILDQPAAKPSVPKGAADHRSYTITVQSGRRRQVVRLVDPIADPKQQELIDFLQQQRAAGDADSSATSGPLQR